MKDFLIFAIIILAIAFVAITAGWIYARPKNWKNYILAPFVSAGILIAIILPFIGGALFSLLQYAKKYK